jgi:hypothetical protein
MLRTHKLTIRTRLIAAFSFTALMFLGPGIFQLRSLRATGDLLNEVTTSRFPAVQLAANLDYPRRSAQPPRMSVPAP